jgi:hypothetical protein
MYTLKSCFAALCLCFTFNATAQDNAPVFQHQNVYFLTPMPGAGEGKMRRLSELITRYFDAVEKDNFEAWKSCFTDSTIARVEPRKFPQKLKRLQEYKIVDDTIRIVEIREVRRPYANEVGKEFELILDFGVDLFVENRVSFDCVKGSNDRSNPRLFGINIIVDEKGYAICEHKYMVNTEGQGNGDGQD